MKIKLLVETPGRKDGAEHIYQVGDVINLEDDLALLWASEGRAEVYQEPSPPSDIPEFEDMTVAELRELAKDKDVSYSGLKKAELIEELEAAYALG